MKVLHLIFSLQTGGTESMLIDIANYQSNKANVSLLIVNNEVHEPLLLKLHQSVKVYRLNRKPGSWSLLPVLKLNLVILKNKYDVIHCHNHNIIGLLLPAFQKKAALTIHTTNIESRYFKKYQKRFSISAAVQEDLRKRMRINSMVVLNGVDFNAITTRRKRTSESLRIIQVSRLDIATKGQNVAIDAIKILANKNIFSITLDFIGEGNSFEQLKKQVVSFGLESNVRFLGLKDRSYIYENLKNYDLLIQPSFFEGFGLTIVEGMAAKLPVLVSDIEGPMEIIKNGQYGFFFKTGDAFDMAEKIEWFLNRADDEINKITENAYLYAKALYSVETTALNYLREYRSILTK